MTEIWTLWTLVMFPILIVYFNMKMQTLQSWSTDHKHDIMKPNDFIHSFITL